MTTTKKTQKNPNRNLPKKSLRKNESRNGEFSWYASCVVYLKQQDAFEIDSTSHPRIFVVDHFLKSVMDGLKENNPDLLKVVDGSPLMLLDIILGDILESKWETYMMPHQFLEVLYLRIAENRKLVAEYRKTKSPDAAVELRKRGLLT